MSERSNQQEVSFRQHDRAGLLVMRGGDESPSSLINSGKKSGMEGEAEANGLVTF